MKILKSTTAKSAKNQNLKLYLSFLSKTSSSKQVAIDKNTPYHYYMVSTFS